MLLALVSADESRLFLTRAPTDPHPTMLLPFSLNPPAHQGTSDSSPPSGPCLDEPLITPRASSLPPPPPLNAEAFLQMAFDASPLPIVALDVQGRVALWNAAAETTFGWTAADALGTLPSPELAELCARALAGEKLMSVAASPARKDGIPKDGNRSGSSLMPASPRRREDRHHPFDRFARERHAELDRHPVSLRARSRERS